MHNVYFQNDKVFLYAAFKKGLNIITEKQESSSTYNTTDNSKYGLYINGQWVSYEDYYRYYKTAYFIDTNWDTTYYAYNDYFYNTLNGTVNAYNSYYIRSYEDDDSKEDSILEVITHSMQCRILHDVDGEIFEDLPWTNMNTMGNNEFYYLFCIPFEFEPSQYQVIYKSVYNVSYYDKVSKTKYTDEELDNINFGKHNINKIAFSMELFYVADISTIYEDTVKIFGTVNYKRSTILAEDVRVSVFDTAENKKAYQSLTDREGHWEAYLYPGQYRVNFHRKGYLDENIFIEVTDTSEDIPFETVSIGTGETSQGTGLFKVFDKYITKKGQPLNGLTVKAYSVENPNIQVAEDITNEDGVWTLYLNEGWYVLKISGTSVGVDFTRTFRLRVNHEGKFIFNNISKNVLTDANNEMISRGDGNISVDDFVKDRWGNPVPDVQVNIYKPNTDIIDENIIAQDYTDGNGEYHLLLNEGKYIFEFYHPNFSTITEEREITNE